MTWQIIAPEVALKIFGLEPYKSKHSFWLSNLIIFVIIIVGIFPIVLVTGFNSSEDLWIILFAISVTLVVSARNLKYYK